MTNMDDVIEKAREYVRAFFAEEYSGHDWFHTLRVYNTAMTIAEGEKCDRDIVALAALLHDVDDYKLVEKSNEEYANARGFMRDNGIDEKTSERICHIISQVSYKGDDSETPDSIEGMIVQDADRLDAIGAIGIARTFTYGGSHHQKMHDPDERYRENMSAEEYYTHIPSTINHFYEKLLKLKDLMNTQTARQLAQGRHKYMQEFLEQFLEEWDGHR